jgi:predicted TIM-barrel fold metal-dependent hydrolase
MRLDFHRHLFVRDGEEDALLRDMDAHAIDRTLLAPLPPELRFMGHALGDNEAVWQIVRRHPDRLIGAVYLDPRDSDAAETLRRYHGEGCRAVKLWPPIGYYPDDPAFYPLYERVAALGLPVLAHTGYTNMPVTGRPRAASHSKYAQIVRFDGLVRAFPEIPFALAHCGMPEFDQAFLLAEGNANAYLNVTGGPGLWDGRFVKLWDARALACAIPFAKLVWGSDNFGLAGTFEGWTEFFRRNGQAQQLDAFFGGLGRRLLKL